MEGGRLRLLQEVSLAGGYWIIAVGSYTQELEHMVSSSDFGFGWFYRIFWTGFFFGRWTLDLVFRISGLGSFLDVGF